MNENKSKFRRALSITGYIFLFLLLILDVLLIIGKLNSSSNGVSNFFGTEIYTVLTGSMEGSDEFYAEHPEYTIKSCPVDSAIFVKRAPEPIHDGDSEDLKITKQAAIDDYYSQLEVGDVLTFVYQHGRSFIITHRIIDIQVTDGVYYFTLRGDNPTGDKTITASSPTQQVQSDSGLVIGKVTAVNVPLGNFIVHFLNNKVAFGLTILIPAGALFIYEIIRIVLLLTEDKREKKTLELQAKEEEKNALIEELRKKVEALEKQQKEE